MALQIPSLGIGVRPERLKESQHGIEMNNLEEGLQEWEINGVSYMPYSEFDFYQHKDLESLIPNKDGIINFSKLTPRFIEVSSPDPSQDESILTGFNNLRMGAPNDFSRPCQTCGHPYSKCQGHLGLINLKGLLFYHPLFIKDLKVLLSCFCMKSFEDTRKDIEPQVHLVVSRQTVENDEKFMGTKGMDRIRLISKTPYCEICGANRREYKTRVSVFSQAFGGSKCGTAISKKKDKYQGLFWEEVGTRSAKHILDESQAYCLLRAFDMLPDSLRFDMLDLLGYTSRPYLSGMILTHLVVVPPNYRNRRIMGPETAKEKISLDETYAGILKCLSSETKDYRQFRGAIANRIITLMNVVLLNNMLSHKSGLIRRDLDGTRCNFSGRTVATLHAWLEMDQVAVPDTIADRITTREKVGKKDKNGNILLRLENAKKMVADGEITSFFPKDKLDVRKVIASEKRSTVQINFGDDVERKLEKDDCVLLNRQPTIHSRGIMGYRVVRSRGHSMRFSMHGTTPFHADFDGDEINIQVPQTTGAKRQCREEANVRNLILNPHDHGVMIGLVFELLDAAFRLTSDVWIRKDVYDNIMNITFRSTMYEKYEEIIERARKSGLPDDKIFNDKGINGRILFSTILHKTFNHIKGNVVISNGILLQGKISSEHIGVHPGGSIIAALILENKNGGGIDAAVDFLNRGNRLLLSWQDHNPTTLGPIDFITGVGRDVRNEKKYEDIRRNQLNELTKRTHRMEERTMKIIWPMERQMMQRTIYQNVSNSDDAYKEIIDIISTMPILDDINIGFYNFPSEKLRSGRDFFMGKLASKYEEINELLKGISGRSYIERTNKLIKFDNEIMPMLVEKYRKNIRDNALNYIQQIIIPEFQILDLSSQMNYLLGFPNDNIKEIGREYNQDEKFSELYPEMLEKLKTAFLNILINNGTGNDILVERITQRIVGEIVKPVISRMSENRRYSRLIQAIAIRKYIESCITKIKEIPQEKIDYISQLIYEALLDLAIHNPDDPVQYLQLIPEILKVKIFDLVDNADERDWIELVRLRHLASSFSDFMKGDNTQLNYLPEDSFVRMAKNAGSKGKDSHPGMDIAVGQQFLRGKFLPVLNGNNRAIVYDRDTIKPRSRGFVEESLMAGVTPRSSFQMHIVGREANIINADETPTSGYAHRRLGLTLESNIVGPKGSLVFSGKKLIQPIYGDDGFSPERMVKAKGAFATPVYSFMDIRKTIAEDTIGMGFY